MEEARMKKTLQVTEFPRHLPLSDLNIDTFYRNDNSSSRSIFASEWF